MHLLLAPPFAFAAYLVLVSVLFGLGRLLAGQRRSRASAGTLYASGEAPSRAHGHPGYQPFFGMALFFGLLHVGVLVASSGGFTPLSLGYLAGLLLVLLVVALG
jgi:hypothetical protein